MEQWITDKGGYEDKLLHELFTFTDTCCMAYVVQHS